MDVVVLMARLVRVFMRHDPLTLDEVRERVEIRNECLDQPFFDRGRVNEPRPFVDDNAEDEGYSA